VADLVYLEAQEVEALHARLIDDFGGSHGLRDASLLESAVARPKWKSLYEEADLIAQVGALMFGLAKNHAFVDGNKRLALAAANLMLKANGGRFTCSQNDMAAFLEPCSDPDWTEEAVIVFVRGNSSPGC
jgi:death-on-curing protein